METGIHTGKKQKSKMLGKVGTYGNTRKDS